MPKKGRVNRTPNIGVKNKAITKGSRKAVTSTKKIAKNAKKVAKKTITSKIAKSYKVTATTGIDPKRVKDAIREIVNLQISRAGAQESTNISKLLLPKIYGLKSTKVVRDILETPAKPSTIQGPTLYGCGGTGLPESGSTSSWFFPEEKRDEMRDSGLVYCWMTLVPCTFKQGGGSYCGRGINHEMEHAIPCTGQVITSLLAQNVNIKSDKPYRKHHVILFEIMKNLLPGIPNQKVKRYVYLIMRMIRRQQVIMGLPSISVANQKKCQLNLLRMKVDSNTLQVRVETNQDEVKNIMNDVDSSNKKGMVQKPSKPISFSPCGWCGIHNSESAFASEERLTELYSTGYSADKVPLAVKLAMDFKAKDNKPKQDILKGQCDLLCKIYNKIADEGLSHLVISASILVLSVIIETTYKELGVETLHMPELFKWVEKAKQILSDASELERLLGEGSDSSVYIIQKSQELGELSGNNVTRDYLNFADATIKDFATPSELGIQVGGAGELDMELEGDDTRTSMFRKDMVPTTPPQRQIVPYNVYDPRAGIPGTPQPAIPSQLNIDELISELNTVFGNTGQTENIGVEENITLMFDHFESMNKDINTDFLSGVEVNIDNLNDSELEILLSEIDLELESELEDMEDAESELDEQAALNRTFTSGTSAAMDALAASVPESEKEQPTLNRTFTSGTEAAMDALAASVPESESEMEESQTLPMDYDSQSTDSEDYSESEEEVEFEDENEDMKLERPLGFGGGKKRSKKKTKRNNTKKSKKRKKNKKTRHKNTKKSKKCKNTKRKRMKHTKARNKKNTKK